MDGTKSFGIYSKELDSLIISGDIKSYKYISGTDTNRCCEEISYEKVEITFYSGIKITFSAKDRIDIY